MYYIQIYIYIYMYKYVCTNMYVHICMFKYVCTNMYVHIYIYVQICIYKYVCTNMYVQIYIYIYMYKYTCTTVYLYNMCISACFHIHRISLENKINRLRSAVESSKSSPRMTKCCDKEDKEECAARLTDFCSKLNAGNFREWSISSLVIIIPATPSNPSIPYVERTSKKNSGFDKLGSTLW